METSTSRPVDAAAGLRGWRRWSLLGLASLAVVALGFIVVTSRVFHASTVRVSGASYLRTAEVVRLSEITHGTNVLWVDPDDVESRLESDPWIERAVVRKDLPSEVRITIEERWPVAVASRGSDLVLVADDGMVLGPAVGNEGLPLVIAGWIPPDGGIADGLAGAALALRTMDAGLRARVDEVMVTLGGALELRLESGTRVLYGPPTEIAEKSKALGAVLRWAERRSSPLSSVDVRSPGALTALLGTPAPR